ncbi:MAG: divergent polysaccharide deacetylase family protein [Candidatus Aminicenantes bacterium]|nr:divergent polysaccharide deacetylase family protein [Candidatus Aminicenantes bacterium]
MKKTMKPKRKTIKNSNRKTAAISFFLFGAIALAAVFTLEFLDYRSGKYSLIFSKLIRLQQKIPAAEKFNRELTAALSGRKIPFDFLKDQGGVSHFKIELPEPLYLPLSKDLRWLVEKNRGLYRLSEVQGMKEQVIYLIQVIFEKKLTHVILISKRLAVQPRPIEMPVTPARTRTVKVPRLAFIIDDIGYADLISDQLRELGIPLTAAIIPAAPYARSEAQKIHEYGLEEIIHLPMQPKDPANHHPRDQFVLTDSSAAEIQVLLQKAREVVPYARGLNNHMGSLLTSNPQAMRRVLERIKGAGLFFVDSRTSPTTLAYALAREMKIKTFKRDVFLDDEQSYEYSSGQIKQLVELARRNGRALAIGHPFPSTLAALRDAIPWLKQQKIEVVFASALLE